jgi:hypothetical protein
VAWAYGERQDQVIEEREDSFDPRLSGSFIGFRFRGSALYAADLTESSRRNQVCCVAHLYRSGVIYGRL